MGPYLLHWLCLGNLINCMKIVTIDNYLEVHYIHRSNWLRAAVLGANDGIISIASLAIGVAAANRLH